MEQRSLEFVQDVVITIHMNIRELKERKCFADPEEQTYIDGKLQAYEEVLATLRMSAKEFGIASAELGF